MNPTTGGTAITLTTIVTAIQSVVNILVWVSGIIVVGAIVWSGIMMATSGSDEGRFKKGKSMLFNAIIGAVVIFGVSLIVSTIASFAQNPANVLR